MSGGTISGNETSGAYSKGGGVQVTSGAFTMTGGSITGNKVIISNGGSGGGVQVSGGTFTMSGTADISHNETSGDGGGLQINGAGAFTMSGGTIKSNTAMNGGGIRAEGSGTFTMSGGSISGNNAAGGNSMGGGVLVDTAVTFTMTNGTISGNTATSAGGGLYVYGVFIMEGGIISGNTTSNCGGGVFVESSGTFDLKDFKLVKGNTANDATQPGNEVYADGTFKINGDQPDSALKDGTNYWWL